MKYLFVFTCLLLAGSDWYLLNENKKLKEEVAKISAMQCEIPKAGEEYQKLLAQCNIENERVHEELETVYDLHQKLIERCAPLLNK